MARFARKSWSELTPTYRARLERKGMTAEAHARGASLSNARGHGLHTPSRMAVAFNRMPAAVSAIDVLRASQRGDWGVPVEAIDEAYAELGGSRMALVMQWREFRNDAYREGTRGDDLPGLRDYVETFYDNYDDQELWDWIDAHDDMSDPWSWYH